MTSPRSKHAPFWSIALTGFMGSGKSTVGALLAHALHWQFIDLDRAIASREELGIPAFFEERGETEFRRIESELLQAILGQHQKPHTVIALGGGTFIQETNRALLREHGVAVLYLESDFDELASRCAQEVGSRPLFRDAQIARRLLEERRPLYRLADFTIDVTHRSPSQVTEAILLEIFDRSVAGAVPE